MCLDLVKVFFGLAISLLPTKEKLNYERKYKREIIGVKSFFMNQLRTHQSF